MAFYSLKLEATSKYHFIYHDNTTTSRPISNSSLITITRTLEDNFERRLNYDTSSDYSFIPSSTLQNSKADISRTHLNQLKKLNRSQQLKRFSEPFLVSNVTPLIFAPNLPIEKIEPNDIVLAYAATDFAFYIKFNIGEDYRHLTKDNPGDLTDMINNKIRQLPGDIPIIKTSSQPSDRRHSLFWKNQEKYKK